MEEETPFNCPAVFIEFLPFTWDTHGQNVQRAEITFRLHIVSKWLKHTAEYGPDQADAISYLDIPEQVYAIMQGNYAGASNGFIRTTSTINHNHTVYVDSIDEYKTYIVNTGAVAALSSASNVTPVITENIPN